MRRGRKPQLLTIEEVTEIYRKEVRTAIEAGFPEYMTPTFYGFDRGSVMDRFLEGLGVISRGKDHVIQIRWKSKRNVNPSKWFREGTERHFIAPVKAKALRWYSDPMKWLGDDHGGGGAQFSKGHYVSGVKAPAEDPIEVGRRKAIARILQLARSRKTKKENQLRKLAAPKIEKMQLGHGLGTMNVKTEGDAEAARMLEIWERYGTIDDHRKWMR